ncbi:hypothetical protein FIU87_12390 [Bacillus sp. THAF10]|uniref:DUF4430 domain-containing protein n=1 Tax=Bacillus sp. THAF10 TaxID=2587848 RepID=UPI001268EBE5|nr:DUF4430 domain-containing protein [Bacillus sp. THAF10]QFT89449.1 hypothetical protein FIU87_12390 [Bacillus sp. THAF10]
MKKAWISLFAALLLVLGGCSETTNETNTNTNNAAPSENQSQSEESSLSTKITLTDEDGEVISEDSMEFEEGESLMDVMDRNFDLTTGFGGGFIVGIDGKGSEEESDYYWHIKVNGEDLMVGANEHILEENDEVHFTYTKVE